MKAVLISIQPKWVEKIANEEKTIEVRKTAPKQVPFKCYIYCTKGKPDNSLLIDKDGHHVIIGDYRNAFNHDVNGNVDWNIGNNKVICEFICDKIEEFSVGSLRSDDIENLACLSYSEMINYFYKPEELDGKTVKHGYAWHISNLKIYDKPKELSEFYRPCSYSGICYSCNRFRPNGTSNDKPNDFCDSTITRASQSWQYVQELEE